jgi:hypothetical protein
MSQDGLDPSQIMQVGMGFWASKTLLSAVELQLFTNCTSRGGKRRCTRGTPMTNTATATQKAGRWKIVPLVVKPNFVSTVLGMADHPDQRLLVVKQQIHAKRFKGGHPEAVFHVYRVQKTTAF